MSIATTVTASRQLRGPGGQPGPGIGGGTALDLAQQLQAAVQADEPGVPAVGGLLELVGLGICG